MAISQASLAVASAAATLADSDTTDHHVTAGLTGHRYEEFEQLETTIRSLHEEVNVLRSHNASLTAELENEVRNFA